jgi:hypothetical protein
MKRSQHERLCNTSLLPGRVRGRLGTVPRQPGKNMVLDERLLDFSGNALDEIK